MTFSRENSVHRLESMRARGLTRLNELLDMVDEEEVEIDVTLNTS